ncbi:MAG: hypothetical protein H8E84_04705 [Flavobacteriales bacterium]|nr:hypothetical protein [Flavobacteriales bacterium]
MRSLLFLLFSIPLIAFSQQTINASITHDNVQRDYILYVPTMYNANNPTPLVLNFHGYTSNANDQMWYGDFRLIADTANFLVVHPQGQLDNSGNTHWNVGWTGSIGDDVSFTAALIDSLSAIYNIDANRIYSTGMSNGGFMSYLLACQLSGRIAAVASVTGGMGPLMMGNCNPQHPIPIMEVHGTADFTVPYNGDTWLESVSSAMDYWVNFNQCDTQSVFTAMPNINTSDGSTAEHFVWKNGLNGVEVEHYKIINGGHSWPGTSFFTANQDISASIEIWRFFSKYDINGLINPATSVIEIEKTNRQLLKVVDVLGRECLPKKNATLFYIFDDGTVEKKLIINN